MITLLKNPPMPLPSKGRPALWLAMSLVFAVSLVSAGILFAADAQAQETNALEGTTEALAAEAAPESGVLPEQTTPPASDQVSGEQAPPVTEPAPPVAEDPPPSSEQTPPSAESPPPTSEPTPPVTEQTPPTGGEALPGAEEVAPTHEQETTEKQAGEVGGEASSEERASEGAGDAQTSTGGSGSDHKELANEVVTASSPSTTTSATAMGVPVISLPTEASQTPTTQESLRSSARRQARQVNRALAAFGASMIATGSVGGWPHTLEASSIAFAAIDASPMTMTATGVRARTRDGDSATQIQSHTSGPGPAPGGAGGGSAAGAGSGAAPSAASMPMDALLRAAPTAMLRLRIYQPSWHTSFFALIPERPG